MFFLIPKNVTSGSVEGTRCGELAAEVSCRLGRHGWSKWRSSANSVGSSGGDGEVQMQSRRRISRNCWLGLRSGEGFRASQSACCVGLGDASASQGRYCGCCVGISSTSGECSLKDVWRSRSGPSRPSCQVQSRVACFYELCCRMPWVRSQKIFRPWN